MFRNITLAIGTALLAVALAATAYAASGPAMGPSSRIVRPAFHGYYDGHKDTFLNTDVSSKTEAAAMHINYSARLATIEDLPEIYFVQGPAAAGQLAILGSEPGEKDYSPV
jgi:hypothetical protein